MTDFDKRHSLYSSLTDPLQDFGSDYDHQIISFSRLGQDLSALAAFFRKAQLRQTPASMTVREASESPPPIVDCTAGLSDQGLKRGLGLDHPTAVR